MQLDAFVLLAVVWGDVAKQRKAAVVADVILKPGGVFTLGANYLRGWDSVVWLLTHRYSLEEDVVVRWGVPALIKPVVT